MSHRDHRGGGKGGGLYGVITWQSSSEGVWEAIWHNQLQRSPEGGGRFYGVTNFQSWGGGGRAIWHKQLAEITGGGGGAVWHSQLVGGGGLFGKPTGRDHHQKLGGGGGWKPTRQQPHLKLKSAQEPTNLCKHFQDAVLASGSYFAHCTEFKFKLVTHPTLI